MTTTNFRNIVVSFGFPYAISWFIYYILPVFFNIDNSNFKLFIFDIISIPVVFIFFYFIFLYFKPSVRSIEYIPLYKLAVMLNGLKKFYLFLVLGYIICVSILSIKFSFLVFFHSTAYDGGLLDIVKSYILSLLQITSIIIIITSIREKIPIEKYVKMLIIFTFILSFANLSKAFVLYFTILFFLIYVLLYIPSKTHIYKFAYIFIISFLLMVVVSASLHNFRESILNEQKLDFSYQSSPSFADQFTRILNRFNLHQNHKYIEGNEDILAKGELDRLEQIFKRITFQTSTLDPPPYVGGLVVDHTSKSAEVINRMLLLDAIGGVPAILFFYIYYFLHALILLSLFYFMLGPSLIFRVFYISMWVSLFFNDGGANIAVSVFNYIMFSVESLSLVLCYIFYLNFLRFINPRK